MNSPEEPAGTVAFWNCGLAPPARGAAVAEEAACEAAGATIHRLVREGTSLLGLCEVDESCMARLRRYLPRTFGVRSYVGRQHRFRWDLALAYDKEVWEVRGSGAQITDSLHRYTYKAGCRTLFRHISTSTEVAVYIAHWRSRLRDGRLARERCGARLRERIAREKHHVLLMGDFNDEPFDKAIENLNASRDMGLVRERSGLLYNPFWRHLGHEDRHDSACGTYYHPNGDTTRWHTFDQILISAKFLGDQGLLYDRSRVAWDCARSTLSSSSRRTHVDHVPVLLNLIVKPPNASTS